MAHRLAGVARLAACLLLALASTPLAAQISDNSFLVEEAYNQEAGVVQHISFYTHDFRGADWLSTFTQEWPWGGVEHQLSYTLTSLRADQATGAGDTLLNYRWQAVGDGNAKLAVSPRFSLSLPTGSRKRGLGAGAVGAQVMLPVSTVLTESLVAHWNAGGLFFPSRGERAWTAAQSFVWLARPRFNVLVESVWTRTEGHGEADSNVVVSPGIRWSYDRPSGLQVVPGIAVPFTTYGEGGNSVILYLSFEHPFR